MLSWRNELKTNQYSVTQRVSTYLYTTRRFCVFLLVSLFTFLTYVGILSPFSLVLPIKYCLNLPSYSCTAVPCSEDNFCNKACATTRGSQRNSMCVGGGGGGGEGANCELRKIIIRQFHIAALEQPILCSLFASFLFKNL